MPALAAAANASGRLACQSSPESAPISIDESNLDTISAVNTPATARMASSPCDSVDYVVVPPSPSIASMYGVSMSGSLSGPPSVLSPRSVNILRPLASPGRHARPSLFSPPPATYHRKYFDAHPARPQNADHQHL
ncbi:hypothetical protein LPJ61_004943 [Coemansia biformis]|uniref:Uncharacterized protein n=1 Tax=Coemansia biformis TaxID=1286918 RepID=A0A9W7Y996_9FUNG|nr:hypothetical protein LPJ61_004943 [Coemansia biformis]